MRYLIKLDELNLENKEIKEIIDQIEMCILNIQNAKKDLIWSGPSYDSFIIKYDEYINSLNEILNNLKKYLDLTGNYYTKYSNGFDEISSDFKETYENLQKNKIGSNINNEEEEIVW